jgi:hypothetical protein
MRADNAMVFAECSRGATQNGQGGVSSGLAAGLDPEKHLEFAVSVRRL